MLVSHFDTAASIDLKHFQACVLDRVNADDPQSMMLVAEELVQLANDDLLSETFRIDLSKWQDARYSMYSPQSAVLAAFDRFVVRLNFWPLLPADPRRRNILASVLSYFDFHDHNFSFLSTNYFGPGYETELYSYDYDNVEGLIGEAVDMQYQGTKRLGKGDVFLFEEGIDIHSQLPPASPSASINLMLRVPGGHSVNEQYQFDTRKQTIKSYVESVGQKQNSLLGFAQTLHDEETVALLTRLADDYPSRGLRANAIRALHAVKSHLEVDPLVFERALRDSSLLVRKAAMEGSVGAAGERLAT